MQFIAQIIVFILCLFMFILPMKYKLSLLLFSFMCFDVVVVDFSVRYAPHLFCLFFFLSELPKISTHINQIKGTLVCSLTILMIIDTVVMFVFSPHYHKVSGPIWLFIIELVSKYFAVAYGFLSIKDKKDVKAILKVAYLGMILLTFFGVLNLVIRTSPWLSMLQYEGNSNVEDFEVAERFRVQSMFENPFCYGYICLLIFIMYLYAYRNKLVNKQNFWIVEGCAIFGIFTCGCRTVWVLLPLVVIIYYSFILKKKQLVLAILSMFMLSVFSLTFMPDRIRKEYADSFMNLASTDTNQLGAGGSSIGMRIVQTATVLVYVDGHYMFGRGKDFFFIDMGWGDNGRNSLVDKDLWGLEGIYMKLILERGFGGLVCWICFCVLIFKFFYKHRKIVKQESALGDSIILLYILFSCMTGELNSATPSFLMIGVMLKVLLVEERKAEQNRCLA